MAQPKIEEGIERIIKENGVDVRVGIPADVLAEYLDDCLRRDSFESAKLTTGEFNEP